jgi:hypothetical protein
MTDERVFNERPIDERSPDLLESFLSSGWNCHRENDYKRELDSYSLAMRVEKQRVISQLSLPAYELDHCKDLSSSWKAISVQ